MTVTYTTAAATTSGEQIGTAIEPFQSLTDAALSGIRQIYDAVPSTRDTLAVLFAVDAAQTSPSETWIGFFVETASAQLIWDERPTGTLTAEAAAWVLGRFDEAPTLSVLAVLVRLVEEAPHRPGDFAAEVRRRATLYGNSLATAERVQSRRSPVPYLRLVA